MNNTLLTPEKFEELTKKAANWDSLVEETKSIKEEYTIKLHAQSYLPDHGKLLVAAATLRHLKRK
ncbi:hypothetical protein Molly5_180 [Maribacter phage Molly_5]|uniref:Uncharacterized protein n=1 Tax=Maribacter phage Molly_1 TaxID=2745685 RepID=A0A8E4UYB3_9CAUD|nr:hypothetical protein M1M29_gp180 [Maribacter phage Molly_1]QQO97678.1 hypothetical protein Molly2_180 [Maribacter phage Molly_2]QQO97878.1 hypothetical protein Molly3_180 [Maribacter phage Molly_3]QQO98078.1 hypothetical protein Molly4_180 [Maribacter phage Molly_4]QQO98278.1 hypothetical protein Molly5_180 [Maribacter phage Molly_5]QQO97478.1 hypothetical protein Molly1_180 [Maribacter phage Molly_1]